MTRDLELTIKLIEMPIEMIEASKLDGKKIAFTSMVVRTGNSPLEGLLDLVPATRVAYVILHRNHEMAAGSRVFFKASSDLADRLVIVVDPMLTTAN